MRFLVLGALLFAIPPPAGQVADAHRDAVDRRVDSLLSLMTLEEKVGQLVQVAVEGEESPLAEEYARQVRLGEVGSFLNSIGASRNREIQTIAMTRSRLKIPLLFGYDVIHGFRTVFPIPLAQASTWEPDLIEKAARVAAIEASSAGIHWTFAPMVDIARDPRWGRIAEGSGEDPLLGSLMAAARVRGFQGDTLARRDALLACPKHYAAYGAAEGGRDYNTVDISERTLREIYLPPFEAAVRAGAGTLMCSFNEIAGVPSSGNRHLLTDILRGEWKFDGFVVSDWGSIGEMQQHGVAGTLAEAAALGITAGVDMDMESGAYHAHLADLVRAGKVPLPLLDESVRRVLRAKFRLGLFDDPYRGGDPAREKTLLLAPEHRNLAREVARHSMVLLKNSNVLPLRKEQNVALIGPLADNRSDLLGCWSGNGREEDAVAVREGIERMLGHPVPYARGCLVAPLDRRGFAEAVEVARKADVAVLVVGETALMSGEAASRSTLGLPGVQEELVRAVAATGVPVVVVLINGRPLAVGGFEESAGAILEAWAPGVEGGNAIVDILYGANPSGRLPVTFPRSVGQIPLYYNHKNTGRPFQAEERFTSKYIDGENSPQYPFGFGLSYTTFDYSSVSLSSPLLREGGSLTVSVSVRNSGKVAGEEVVQLYIQDPVASVTRPVAELKAFRKVSLRPGEEQRVDFILTPEMLAMFDLSMHRVVEPGAFIASVGGNARDLQSAAFQFESAGPYRLDRR